MLQQKKPAKESFGDIVKRRSDIDPAMDIHLHNQKIYRMLKLRTPVIPTEDILRYVIDNSPILEDWQKDILEVLRTEGRYYWPQMKTKYMNEGWATYWHEKILGKLFQEGLLTSSEHSQYNYSNSLVKAQNPVSMNPYLIGCEMWKDIEERWDKGKHGRKYENCTNRKEKEEWDTKEGKGLEKIFQTMRTCRDWFFMQNFLTPNLVDNLELYLYQQQDHQLHVDYVITEHEAKEIAQIIINSFAHSGIPKIEIANGNHSNAGEIRLEHRWSGANLDQKYAEETMKHLYRLWGKPILLNTKVDNKPIAYRVTSRADQGAAKSNWPDGVKTKVINSKKILNPLEHTNFIKIE